MIFLVPNDLPDQNSIRLPITTNPEILRTHIFEAVFRVKRNRARIAFPYAEPDAATVEIAPRAEGFRHQQPGNPTAMIGSIDIETPQLNDIVSGGTLRWIASPDLRKAYQVSFLLGQQGDHIGAAELPPLLLNPVVGFEEASQMMWIVFRCEGIHVHPSSEFG